MKNQEQKNMQHLPGGVTAGQVAKWKAQHGEVKVFEIPIDDQENGKVATGYFHKPDLDTLSAAMKFGDDPIKAGNVLFENCYLGGDPEIKNDPETKMSAIQSLTTIFKIRTARIKNA